VVGPAGTFHGFDEGLGKRVDYVFVPSATDVASYRTVARTNGTPRSDHLPVYADLDIDR
jgi:endonuclease/exonuclease/phosphatase family metal-dependent hydrolase